MPKLSEVDFKINFIKFLSSLKGWPKEQQQQLDRIIKRIKQPDIVITEEDKVLVSILIASLFCRVDLPTFPMTNENKKEVDSYSNKNLRDHTAKSGLIKGY